VEKPPGTHADTVNVLVLGTAEWNSPIATNQHYVVRELARAHDVRFVESMGLRRPRLDGRDCKERSRPRRRPVDRSPRPFRSPRQ
jgi:teichuronic acid biosynthesis glycosyltransferase TuaH